MCGIAGFLSLAAAPGDHERRVRGMLDVIAHRGPDGEGLWSTSVGATRVAWGHKRLAILDLTPAGAQPMISPCGRYALNYNGELYNFVELRDELAALGVQFQTQCDTEVVLRALMVWGPGAFARFNGMWALAFLDIPRQRMILSRDRFGEKPLYYHRAPRGFYFASEIKAICAGSGERFGVDATVAARFLGQSLLDAQDETFFAGVQKVRAGHFVDIRLDDAAPLELSAPKAYDPLRHEAPESGLDDIVARLRETFLDSVRIRLRSDVPVGVLLSGGLDSSSIAAAMHAVAPNANIAMISAVSDNKAVSEEPYIDAMGRHLGRDVVKVPLRFDATEGLAELRDASWYNDEPVSGFSSVAHRMLMRKARDLGVTVLLSGQGSDELLCGYAKYYAFYLEQLFRQRRYLSLLSAGAHLLKPPMTWLSSARLAEAKRYLPGWARPPRETVFGPSLMTSGWGMDMGLGADSIQARQESDLALFSVPILTHYEDRMSMAASREIRLPFLDHRLVQMLVPLPAELKLRHGWTKWVFRKAMEPLLPHDVVWRRDKKGFSNPIAFWMRNEWQGAIRQILREGLLIHELGLVDQTRFAKLYDRFCEGRDRWIGIKDVFNPISLELWARRYHAYLGPSAELEAA